MLSDLHTILFSNKGKILTDFKNKIFQISYNRLLQIMFRNCFWHIKKIKHIIIKENITSCSSWFFDGRGQRFLRQHISFIISAVNLSFQFSFGKTLFDAHIHIKYAFFHALTRRHNFKMVRPTQLCHQWWHFFVVLIKLIKLLHSVKSTTIKSFQLWIIGCEEICDFLHKSIAIFSVFRLLTNVFTYITIH